MRCRLMLAVTLASFTLPALAATPQRSLQYLTTGNGFGFQVYDATSRRIKQFLERPYRYLRPGSDPKGDGPVRRNVAYDVYFGIVAGADHGWLPSSDTDVAYVEETNVIRSTGKKGSIETESYFFAPFGYSGNAMVMLLKATNAGSAPVAVDAAALFNFHMGTGLPDSPNADGESVSFDSGSGVATETGPGGGALIYVPIGGVDRASCSSNAYNEINGGSPITPQASCSGNDLPEVFQRTLGTIAAGQSGWWGAVVLYEPDGLGAKDAAVARWSAFLAKRDPQTLLQGVLDEWKTWRKTPPAGVLKDAKDTAIWRQSEAVLRMGQVREPWSENPKLKNHGMVLASLPPGGWHTGWVRDAQYAMVALARLGHCEEARLALEFFLNAEANRFKSQLYKPADYRISVVRYFGNGVEEADYSGQPTPNIELDGWGMYLWSARIYVDLCNDPGWLNKTTRYGENIYKVINELVAGALEKNLEPPPANIVGKDTSIWEVHMDKAQHFFYTSAAAARGFCDMATLATRAGKDADAKHYADLAKNVVAGIQSNFADQNKVLAGSVEKLTVGQYHDGATVEAVTWNLFAANSQVASATLGGFSTLKTKFGGYKRIEGSTDPYDINEWILIDLRTADAFRRMGKPSQADQLLGWVTDQAAANYNLLPELYDVNTPNGSYTGSIPMVGYGAGAYVITLLQRAGIVEPSGCAEAPKPPTEGPQRMDFPPATDGNIQPGVDAGGNGNPAATGFACLCRVGDVTTWAVVPCLLLVLLALGGFWLRRRR